MRNSKLSWALAFGIAVGAACGDAVEPDSPPPESADAPAVDAPAAETPAVGEGEPVAAASETPAPSEEADGTAAMQELLEKKVSFDFKGAGFAEIAQMITVVTGAKIVIDPELAPDLEDVPITLKLTDVSAIDALRTLARIIGDAEVDVREDAVWITRG